MWLQIVCHVARAGLIAAMLASAAPGEELSARDVEARLREPLRSLRPGAHIITEREVDWGFCPAPRRDQVVSADFNGDGILDYAAIVGTGPGSGPEEVLVVFLGGPDGRFKVVVLERIGGDAIIQAHEPGRVHDMFSGRPTKLVLPGIDRYYCGKSARVYYWSVKAQKFRFVPIGD